MNQYQSEAKRTASRSKLKKDHLMNYTLGLSGEAGEVADIVKKHLFHGHPLDEKALKDELGDVLWYLANLASSAGINLQDIADHNIQKLYARYPDGFSEERSINREDNQ